MAYRDLVKLYYQDKDEHKKAYEERINSHSAVKLDFTVGEHSAFYVVCQEIVDLLCAILRNDKMTMKIGNRLPAEALEQYSKRCLIDEIVLTNDIEGVHSSRKEIGEVLDILESQSQKRSERKRFHGLVNKYSRLMKNDNLSIASCEDVRKLYDEIVLDEVKEENPDNIPDGNLFRKERTAVITATGRELHAGIMPESRIVEYMDKALKILNDEQSDPLISMALFHYMVGYIHPFYDGNGRLARFILSYCISYTLEPILAFRISETIKENIKEYYKAFEVCNDNKNMGDLTPFIIMILKMVNDAQKEINEALHKKHIEFERYKEIIEAFGNGGRNDVEKLYDYLMRVSLFGERGASTAELMNVLGMSYGSLRIRLNTARQEGILIETREKKEKYYSLDLKKLDDILIKYEL